MFGHPGAQMIGVRTGEVSGLDILDIDPRNGGDAWKAENLHNLVETRTHETPSGGWHLLFVHAPGVNCSAGQIAPGVDVRSDGGYAIWPGSPGYWVICDAPIAPWPHWLLPLILAVSAPVPSPTPATPLYVGEIHRTVHAALAKVRNAKDGQKRIALRNAGLWLGGVAEAIGADDDTLVRWLLEALPSTVKSWRTAEATARWAVSQGRERPVVFRR